MKTMDYYKDGVVVPKDQLVDGENYEVRVFHNGVQVSAYETTYYTPLEDKLIPITVTGITGTIKHASDFSKVSCYEGDTLVVSGGIPIPDRTFFMPISRADGQIYLFEVELRDGAFEAHVTFPTSGIYRYSIVEANHDLPEAIFTIQTIDIDVLIKPAA